MSCMWCVLAFQVMCMLCTRGVHACLSVDRRTRPLVSGTCVRPLPSMSFPARPQVLLHPPHRHLTSRSLEVILCLRFSFCAVILLMGLREGHLARKILAPHP